MRFFFFFVCEVPRTPFSPHQRAQEAPCKVQKTTVKDNNWVSYRNEWREEGGENTAQRSVSQNFAF